MIRNKSTIQIISRLLMAVFLFVIISPISVYAAGDSASDNDADEEYVSWSDAFDDSDYTDNLAEMVARYWISTYLNYVGTGQDVSHEIQEMLGVQYDNTVSLYDNLYHYILPISTQTVMSLDPSQFNNLNYGKPIRNKNNLKLIQDTAKSVNDNVNSTLTTIATNKGKGGDTVTPDVFPSWFHIALKNPANNLPFQPNLGNNTPGSPCVFYVNNSAPAGYNTYDYIYGSVGSYNNIVCCISDRFNSNTNFDYGFFTYDNQTFVNTYHQAYIKYRDGSWNTSLNTEVISYKWLVNSLNKGGDVYFYQSGYIEFQTYSDGTKVYFWDNDSRTLYFIGTGNAISYFGTTSSDDVIGNYTVNIINSVNYDDFIDLIDQMMIDVNMSNDITNSLLIEILQELRDQRDNYVENDGDDIYNYIDYMMQKLLEVKDIHIEIPDISPDLGGIADALTALLNFLATIIRTIGSIVETLIQGLLDLLKLLFIPDESSSNEISIQINNISKPIIWIGDFMDNSKRMISVLLLGDDSLNNDGSGEGSGEGGSGSGTQDPPVITVDFANSTSEYDYGGEVAIMDLSWYAPYKSICDPIIVAFCWVMFIVRVVKDIPGIINGFSSNNKEGE